MKRASTADTVATVRDLAWTGQHARAVERATQALAARALETAERMTLLDLRAESLIAQGKLNAAADDAAAMHALAAAQKKPALLAQALNRTALVQMRRGDLTQASKTATNAVGVRHAVPALRAESHLLLGEVNMRTLGNKAAIEHARKAIGIFQRSGNASGTGRAHWVIALVHARERRNDESRAAAQTALALCREAGDQYGVGNALNALAQTSVDIGERMRQYQQATVAFETAGYAERLSIVLGNLAVTYSDLGLYSHARRLLVEHVDMGGIRRPDHHRHGPDPGG